VNFSDIKIRPVHGSFVESEIGIDIIERTAFFEKFENSHSQRTDNHYNHQDFPYPAIPDFRKDQKYSNR
jgi:hypothetical protein